MVRTIRIGLVALLVAGAAAAAARADEPGERQAREALRQQAQEVAQREISALLVRRVAEQVVESDAARLVARLREEQVEALARGDDLLSVLSLPPGEPGGPAPGPRRAAAAIRLLTGAALGDHESDLLFVPLAPCRVIDTRLGGGPIAAGVTRSFEVAGTDSFAAQGGNPAGCGIPLGATDPAAPAVVFNFVAVGPAGPGHLEAWEFGQPVPIASVINYAKVAGLNIANGVVVPISGIAATAKDLHIRANVNGTHVVADVTGYFTRFPVEQFQGTLKSDVLENVETTLIDLSSGNCQELNRCTVTSDAAGTVIVEAWGQAVVNHVLGTDDRLEVSIETASAVACDQTGTNVGVHEVSGALGSSSDVDFGFSIARAYSQPAGQTRTYRLSGEMTSGAGVGGPPPDQVEFTRLICTFIPD